MTPEFMADWVAAAPDESTRELRMAVHTILVAVSRAPTLPNLMVLKGGILLALQYQGDRFTRDIDFSTGKTVPEMSVNGVVEELTAALSLQVQMLNYGLDCRIQGHELKPPGEHRTWPTLQLRIGYAPMANLTRHRRLVNGKSPAALALDLSYNEVITAVELVSIPGGAVVQAYTLPDLIAEKLRAMLQQPSRHRNRRQDVYDLYRVLSRPEVQDGPFRAAVLQALQAKTAARNLAVNRQSIADPEVRRRSERDYAQLRAEISSELPDFEQAYTAVQNYYECLPWGPAPPA
ncbi:MAG: nucleotidyl transferase AbiEii/AbiGii toxin family protein [Pseudomonadota bacterium]|jgi:predicted nucleotidyltransferase component of viral defense system|nr:nucleotidyl transferase AbiEii/AbiGii toxin family protein [Pseudomonadota bacterium]